MIRATNWHLLRIILIVVYMFSKHLCYNMWIYDMIYDIIIWCMCDLVWYMSIWWYTWSSWWCTHDLEHICRCDLVWYLMIWVYDALAHLVEILYHFYENYMPLLYDIIPRIHETRNPSEFWAIPVLDNALVPCYARLVHKSQRGL